MRLFGKKVSIIGLGITGFYTALFLKKNGADVYVSDIKGMDELKKEYVDKLKYLGCHIKAGGYDEKTILDSDILVLSPGVSSDLDVVKKAKECGVEVIAEIELAYRFCPYPIVAITGTNGKSTVTSMIGHVFEQSGVKVFVGGNLGKPFISCLLEDQNWDLIVLEISSFQLENIKEFCPYVSIILNITPDHMDRYKDFRHYADTKLKIFKNQKENSFLILNDDDPILSKIKTEKVKVLRFGKEEKQNRTAFLKNDSIEICFNGIKEDFSVKDIPLLGEHNIINTMPVLLVAFIFGIKKSILQKAVSSFKPLPHRLEPVFQKQGILFINDSKATNVDSAIKAIEGIDASVILIAGGKNKGLDFSCLAEKAKGKVKHAVFIGESAFYMLKEFKDRGISSELANDMYEAVSKAVAKAKKGDVVLFSPACASFDMFESYSHRGEVFKETVRRIFNDERRKCSPV